MTVVYFLQNAWSVEYAGKTWPRELWLVALAHSRSGQRLSHLLDDYNQCENCTPQVGASANSLLLPNLAHIQALLDKRSPNLVVACGKHAEKALLTLWSGALLAVPHPSHRLVTNTLYHEARLLVAQGFTGQWALRQAKHHTQLVSLRR